MAIQAHKPHSNKKRRRKQIPWVLWTVVGAVILVIISFTFAVFLILHNQSISQGINTLTIISIVIGVVISLLGLMISFLQWHHPKPSPIPEPSTAPPTSTQLTPSIGPATESTNFFEQ